MDAAARRLNLQVLVIAALVVAGFFYFEKIVGLVPCELCLRERLPWYAAIVLSVAVLAWHPRPATRLLPIAFVCLFLVSVGMGIYHVLVEQHVVAGPTACTGLAGAGKSVADLRQQLLATPVVQCDVVQWRLLGISLAGWNALVSFAVVVLAAHARRRLA